jgi:TonB family protein
LSGIFISYRRSDSQGEAGRLFDDLANHFGEQLVFMDVAAIEAGRDFRKAIEEGVAKCGVLLVMIGLEWLDAKDEAGTRRLNDPLDFVRIETASALKRDIPVIPVLVRGARMPSAEQLPPELKELAYRNCIELTHARWKSDVQLLTDALRRLLAQSGEAATRGAAIAATRPAPAVGPEAAAAAEGSSPRIDPAALQRVRKDLALRIGPIANIVVNRAALHCKSIEDVYLKVAEEIDSPDERQKFLRERPLLPSSSLLDTTASSSAATALPGAAGPSERPAPSEDPSKTASAARKTRSPNRRNAVFAAGGVVCLIALVFVVTRFAPFRGAGASQAPLASVQQTHAAESSSDVTGGATLPTTGAQSAQSPSDVGTADGGDSAPSQRVHVPQEVFRTLLTQTVLPVYPVLAQQARIQGLVVLDADISRDGRVETLKAVSGHPLLVPAALNAVKQWRYKPYVVNGKPVAVSTQIIVNFALTGG